MADTYGVTAMEVASQVPSLFPAGFSSATKPAVSVVNSWISAADTIVTLAIRAATGTAPGTTDASAPLAKQYVYAWVLGRVMAAVYAGNAPDKVSAVVRDYSAIATALLVAINNLDAQAVGTAGVVVSNIRYAGVVGETDVYGTGAERIPLVSNDELGIGARQSLRF